MELSLEPIEFKYGPLTGDMVNQGQRIEIKPNGHQVVVYRGEVYLLKDIYFEVPSQVVIDGKRAVASVYWQHVNAAGKPLRIITSMEEGDANPLTTAVWKRLPLEKNDSHPILAAGVSLQEWIPKDTGYYLFSMPPTGKQCQYKSVTHVLMRNPTFANGDQIQALGSLYGVQINGERPASRMVFRSR